MDKKKVTIGETIDKLMENPDFVISQLSKIIIEKTKTIENLELKLKNKKSEIDYLQGKISVYEKFFKIGVDIDDK